MNGMDTLRHTLIGMGKESFSAKELIEEHGYGCFVYKQIGKLVSGGEVVKEEGSRPAKFNIIKLKDIASVRKDKRSKARSMQNEVKISSPWSGIFPEFFTMPRFTGQSRFVINLAE